MNRKKKKMKLIATVGTKLEDVMDRNYAVITFISKYLYFKKTQSSHFGDVIKIANIFIKKIFKAQSEKNQKLGIKTPCISVFLDVMKVADFR